MFWVHVGTQARFQDGYRRIAEAVKIKGFDDPKVDIIRLVYNWLCDESNGRWVMVIDNADDSNVFYPQLRETRGVDTSYTSHERAEPLSDFLPQSSNGSILVTSRNRDVAFRLTGSYNCIREVKPMEKEDALALLSKKVISSPRDDAVELLQALDYMPLAITQAAACIGQRAPRMTVSRYLDEIRRSDTRLLQRDMGDSRRDGRASNSIITTWQISFEYIQRNAPAAARLLSLMSFFDRQGIPEALLRDRYQESDVQSDFDEDIHTLMTFSLVRSNEDGNEFEMHRLVQFTTKKWLELHNDFEEWKEIYLSTLNETRPSTKYENWKLWQKLFPHAEICLEYKPLTNNCILDWVGILYTAGRYAAKRGEYRKAQEILVNVLDVSREAVGEMHHATRSTLDALATVLSHLGNFKEAEDIHLRALKWEEENLGPNHSDTYMSRNNLALVLMRQERNEEAEALQRQALRTAQRIHGRDHIYTLRIIANLGQILQRLGKHAEAEAMVREVLEVQENMFGLEHLETVITMGEFGMVLSEQGKYEEGEIILRRSLISSEKILGREHKDTLVGVENLASALSNQGKFEEAEALYFRSFEAGKRVLGPEHPHTISYARSLQWVREKQGKTAWPEN